MGERKRRSRSAADGGEEAGPPPRVTKLLVTWGEELIQPLKYNSFRVGPIAAEVVVEEGDYPKEVFRRTMAELGAMAALEYEEKLRGFTERRLKAIGYVRERGAAEE